jgi:pheromone a factor receptor
MRVSFAGRPRLLQIVLIPGLLNLVALALRWFLLRRMQFTAVLHASPGGLTTGRYLRLVSLTLVDVTIVIFGALYQMINNFSRIDLSPYGTWQEAHQDFGQIQQFSEDVASDVSVNAMTLYLLPLYSFVFFIFFGFGEEAIREYLLLGRMVAGWFNFLGIPQR